MPLVLTKNGKIHHTRLATEQCNLDDSMGAIPLTASKAEEHVAGMGTATIARLCEHCFDD